MTEGSLQVDLAAPVMAGDKTGTGASNTEWRGKEGTVHGTWKKTNKCL